MRIALVNSSKPTTGAGRVAFEVSRRIGSEHGFDHLFLDYDDRSLKLHSSSGTRALAQFARVPEYRYFFYYRAQRKLPEYDLYHLANQNLSFLNLRPKIVTCLDVIHSVYPNNLAEFMLSKGLYSGLKSADYIISISQATKNDLIEYFSVSADRIRVIPPGVDHDVFNTTPGSSDLHGRHGLSRRYRYLFHVSSETPRKNMTGLLQALAILRDDFGLTDLRLLKAGRPQFKRDRRRVISSIKELGLEGSVVFFGGLPDGQLADLYRLADVFVFPSYYEGFGLPPLESMACGTPVVASDTSSLPEVVGNAGLMVNPGDTQALAESVHQILIDRNLREDLAAKGVERAREFTWEKAASATLRTYGEFFDGGGPAY